METPKVDNASPSTANPPAKSKPAAPSTLAEFVAASGGITAGAFLRKVSKGAAPIPSSDDIREMVGSLQTRPDGPYRVVLLLQAIEDASGSLRESIFALAEELLRARDALPSSPPPLSAEECRLAMDRLLRPATPKGSKPTLDLFCVFLLFAFLRGWITEDHALAFLERAFPAAKPERPRAGDSALPDPSPTAIILGTSLKKPNLPHLLELNSAWKKRTANATEQIRQLQSAIAQLESEKAGLRTDLQGAREEIAALKAEAREKAQRIRDLEKEQIDAHTTERHRYDALKGRLRGFLEGELSRWLQNATEAANLEPPRTRVIQERLQSAISGIQKETQWLQSSD